MMDVLGHVERVESGRNQEVQQAVAKLQDDWRSYDSVVGVEEAEEALALLQVWWIVPGQT